MIILCLIDQLNLIRAQLIKIVFLLLVDMLTLPLTVVQQIGYLLLGLTCSFRVRNTLDKSNRVTRASPAGPSVRSTKDQLAGFSVNDCSIQGRPAKYMGPVPNFNLGPNYRNNITKVYFIATSIKQFNIMIVYVA